MGIEQIDLMLTAMIMLLGETGDWEYYETDPNWWALRVWTRRN